VNKTSIKVIKRKEAETENTSEPKAALSPEKAERHVRREMVNTVASWISERRENNRIEEITAIRQIFGSEPLLS
jgi:hypothetical protein